MHLVASAHPSVRPSFTTLTQRATMGHRSYEYWGNVRGLHKLHLSPGGGSVTRIWKHMGFLCITTGIITYLADFSMFRVE